MDTVKERFLRYVKIDTQSDASSSTCPSTEKQKNLGNLLVKELLAIGIEDAHIDAYGYVYASIKSNTTKKVPTLCFCAHIDTAPDCSGKNVRPIIHKKYDGTTLVLPKDTKYNITPDAHPDLLKQIGNDIITTDGTTLLGADDKAGIAAIMDAAYYLKSHPEVKHGTIKLLFTPDEEIGRGADRVNLKQLKADYAYTIDGGGLGNLSNETFSADSVDVSIYGVSTHPGTAKGKLENAIKIAADIVAQLPKDTLSPETTEEKEGFIHPHSMQGKLEEASLSFLIRDFNTEGLKEKENYLLGIVEKVMKQYPKSRFEFKVTEQYRNMKEVLDKHPSTINNAMEAMKKANVEAKMESIRGGTDGSRLSFMGLPCPNLFTGGHAGHSKQEWVSVQDMQKAVETIVNIAMEWEQTS